MSTPSQPTHALKPTRCREACGASTGWTTDPSTWPMPTPKIKNAMGALHDLIRISPLRWRATCPACNAPAALWILWLPPCPACGRGPNGVLGLQCERGCVLEPNRVVGCEASTGGRGRP